jgi:hypothetical protein
MFSSLFSPFLENVLRGGHNQTAKLLFGEIIGCAYVVSGMATVVSGYRCKA